MSKHFLNPKYLIMEQVIRTVNGVDLTRLKETVMAVTSQPALGRFQFRASNEWINAGHNRSTIKGFYGAGQEDTSRTLAFILDNDEPDVLLGENKGANPVEQLLHALAGCLTTTLVYHASARGYKIDRIESALTGELNLMGFLGIDPTVRKGYDNVQVSFNIEGDLTKEQKEEIIKLGPQFSPVFDIVTNKVPVRVSLSVN